MLKKIMIFSVILFLGANVFAQSMDEAGTSYNEGNEKYTAKDYAGAIVSFEEALDFCNTVGFEADDLKANVQKQLNKSYYQNGISLYKKRNYNEAISYMQKSLALSEELGDESRKVKGVNYIAKIYSTSGQSLIKEKKLDEALIEFDKAFEIKPTCVNASYGKVSVYKEMGDMTLMMKFADKAILDGGDNAKAAKTVAKVKKKAGKELYKQGTLEINREHGAKAAEYLNASMKYATVTVDTYYYLAIAYNKSKAYSKAIESANIALGLQEGDKSDIYYEIGQAQEALGNVSAACKAYKNVNTGNKVENAKYQITTVLKCA